MKNFIKCMSAQENAAECHHRQRNDQKNGSGSFYNDLHLVLQLSVYDYVVKGVKIDCEPEEAVVSHVT